MRCPQCGAPLHDPARSCARCGASPPADPNPGGGPPQDPHRAPTRTTNVPTRPPAAEAPDFSPGSTFAGRFTIIEEVAGGGMGIVFKAIDVNLRQHVALKIIRPELARRREFVERFRREVTVARQISHPNVCRVHDIGQVGGTYYLSMEWIEGETLRRLIRQAERLEEHRALDIAAKIARALGAAHAKGIIHRDLKPENVMIDRRGEVYVMDFGLAKVVGPGRSRMSGILGTPGYMAPEQMQEGGKVDERADLYALGLILQEMLTGKPPARDLDHSSFRSLVSGRVAPVVRGLLAEDRDARPGNAKAVRTALEKLSTPGKLGRMLARAREWGIEHRRWMTALVLLAIAIVVVWALIPPPAPDPQAKVFYERGLLYLGEESSTEPALNNAVNMFHRCLQADDAYVACRARLGEAYWRWFEVSRDPGLRTRAVEAVEAASQQAPDLPEVRLARSRGFLIDGRNQEAKEEILELVHDAPKLDEGWAALARAHRQMGEYAEGRKALDEAIRLNPQSYHHRVSLGKFFVEFSEYQQAVNAFQEAIALKPDSSHAWSNLGGVYLKLGNVKEAAKALQESQSLEESSQGRSNLGTVYYALGRYEEAAANYRRATELNPKVATLWGNLGDALRMLDDAEGSREAYREAQRLARENATAAPLDPESRIYLGLWCARAGDLECAQDEARQALDLQPQNTQTYLLNAVVHCNLDRLDDALDFLDRGVSIGLRRADIEMEPDFAPLRGSPRYEAILALAG